MPTDRSRPFSLSGVVVAASCWLLASPAFANDEPKPAVDRVNVQISGGYGYEETAAVTASGGGTTSDLPGAKRRGPEVGAALAFPIHGAFGGRAKASGRLVSAEYPAYGTFPGGDASGFGVRAGFDLFVRNPDSGFFEVGYRFRWGDPAEDGWDDELANGVNAAAGFFIPDQGLGPIDWRTSVRWLRGNVEGAGISDDFDEIAGTATSGWYMGDAVRFTGGFEWMLERPASSPDTRDLRGSAELAWLLPLGRVRYVTLSAKGTGGKRHDAMPAPLEAVDRNVWSVGGAVSFNFPGATSLVQLARERQ